MPFENTENTEYTEIQNTQKSYSPPSVFDRSVMTTSISLVTKHFSFYFKYLKIRLPEQCL